MRFFSKNFQVPLCNAKTRAGKLCRAWAMANGRCRMHGGASTGPRTPEGVERIRQLRYKHGKYSVVAKRKLLKRAIKYYELSTGHECSKRLINSWWSVLKVMTEKQYRRERAALAAKYRKLYKKLRRRK